MQNYIFLCCLKNDYYHYLYPHIGAARMDAVEEMARVGPLQQQNDSVSPGNFKAPQCEYSTLSVPTSVMVTKLCGS